MCRNWNPYTLLVGMWNGAAAVENSLVLSQIVKPGIMIWHSYSTPVYVPKIIENRYWNKYLYTNVHSSTYIAGYGSQKVETIQM